MTVNRIWKALPLALALVAGVLSAPAAAAPKQEKAVLAGGCFWGLEAVFESLRGVSNVVSGFSGGAAATAHYDIVSTGTTGHAESVEITYDPSQISYRQLLQVYFTVATDPTELNYQGPDHGTQYRSSIFYTTDAQKQTAQAMIRELTAAHAYSAPIVTTVVPFVAFYPAEAYHQHYLQLHPDEPYIVYNDMPKLKALHEKFAGLVKSHA
ncbi:MAG TPA: peptide-methionine (S)-S-oxide reductase MsrA [Candidatus Elarobacter sp.]|jgi:peptide-methionine (S)-S-oxide reductase|nr:peptide-methionine (S)-S-oxide reductase MsrA [Candidatus Elarobacter sp.]